MGLVHFSVVVDTRTGVVQFNVLADVCTTLVQSNVLVDDCIIVVQFSVVVDVCKARLSRALELKGRGATEKWATIGSQAAWETRAIIYREYPGY